MLANDFFDGEIYIDGYRNVRDANGIVLFREPLAGKGLANIVIKALAAEPRSIPQPKCIERSGRVTVVAWEDGTTTAVKLPDDAAYDDPYLAYLSALGKKLYGTTAKLHKEVDVHQKSYLQAQKDAEIEKKRQENREREERNRRRKVRAMAKRMRLEQEAAAYNAESKGE
jgi:hypothetical protein